MLARRALANADRPAQAAAPEGGEEQPQQF